MLMLTNLYLAYTDCSDVVKHIEIDNASLIGFNDVVVERCSTKLLDSDIVKRGVIIVPRKIVYLDSSSIDRCLTVSKNTLAGCIPLDVDSARRLAKVNKTLAIILTTESSRFVNEYQVNFMAQSAIPKYIEIHLYPFVSQIADNVVERDIEKDFYNLGNIIECALKRDVGVIPVAASPTLEKMLIATHIDVILYSLGFSKRERRLMLELYPVDFLKNWLNQ